jgi:hypothetical protein
MNVNIGDVSVTINAEESKQAIKEAVRLALAAKGVPIDEKVEAKVEISLCQESDRYDRETGVAFAGATVSFKIKTTPRVMRGGAGDP